MPKHAFSSMICRRVHLGCAFLRTKDGMTPAGNHYLNVVARLKRGYASSALRQKWPDRETDRAAIPRTKAQHRVVTVREQLVGDVRPAADLLGAVAFVLLIACVNIAT